MIRWWRLSVNGASKSTSSGELLAGLLTPQTGMIKIVEKMLKTSRKLLSWDCSECDQLPARPFNEEVEWDVAQVMDDHDTITRRALAALKIWLG